MWAAAAIENGTTVAQTPPTSAKVDEVRALMPALAGLVILLVLGIGLVWLTWWGARYARRRMGKPLGPSHPLTDEWYSKPLVERPPPPADDQESQMGS